MSITLSFRCVVGRVSLRGERLGNRVKSCHISVTLSHEFG